MAIALDSYPTWLIMLDTLYPSEKALQRVRRSWLREQIDSCLRNLFDAGYKQSSLNTHANWFLCLAEFAEQRNILDVQRLPELIEPLVSGVVARETQLKKWRSALTWFVRHAAPGSLPAISKPTPLSMCPHADVIETYVEFLRDYRGLCEMRVRHIQRHILALMAFLGQEGLSGPSDLNPGLIQRFITDEGGRCGRQALKNRCSSLRGFFSFLHRRGLVPIDWSSAVLSPKVYRYEHCPRFLTHLEVESVLAAIGRQTPQGKRDYAMFLLMTVYGLRGIEVRQLRLDAIDWRAEKIHIRGRKAGNSTTYPLATSVGEAILEYLKGGRPKTTSRQVFISSRPPYQPLSSSATLTSLVCKYIRLASVQVATPGTHTFRYTCAQRLLEQGLPLKSIGDYLGHGHSDSTQFYLKIAIDQLREVAMGDAEEFL